MIQIFRKYQKFMFAVLIFIAMAMVFSSLGLEMMQNSRQTNLDKAIIVDDQVITQATYQRQVRQLESQYRQMLGAGYDQMIKQFGISVKQNVIDNLVDNAVLDKYLIKDGFTATDDQVREKILEQFPGGYDPNLLLSSGLTPSSFLTETKNQVIREQFFNLLSDIALPTEQEKKDAFLEDETKNNIEIVSFSPSDMLPSKPSDEDLQSYFETNQERYRTKQKVSFKVITFKPEDFLSKVEVPIEEIEFYYSDNENEFKNPESLNIQHIQLLYPKDSDPIGLASVKQKASEIHNKAKALEDFKSLALKNSDDVITRLNGGNLGWVPRGRYGNNFDEKAFKAKEGGIADLIETEYGFHIVKVNGYKESSIKPLEEVRATIEEKLKKEQAPAIADAAAREFFDKLQNDNATFDSLANDDVIKDHHLKIASSNGFIEEGASFEQIPSEVLAKMMKDIPEIKQHVEHKNSAYIFEVQDFKESEIPDINLVKESVIKDFQSEESIKLAKSSAENFLQEIQSGKDFSDLAKQLKLQVKSSKNLTPTNQDPILTSPEARDEIFKSKDTPSIPTKVISSPNLFSIVRVVSRDIPDYSKATPEQLKKAYTKAKDHNEEKLKKEFLESFKRQSKITVEPSLLAEF